jgi:hypothetical protein
MEALRGEQYRSGLSGGKAELATGSTLWTAAYTATGCGAQMRNPWSGYPGYTSVQYGDIDDAGENAFMLRVA